MVSAAEIERSLGSGFCDMMGPCIHDMYPSRFDVLIARLTLSDMDCGKGSIVQNNVSEMLTTSNADRKLSLSAQPILFANSAGNSFNEHLTESSAPTVPSVVLATLGFRKIVKKKTNEPPDGEKQTQAFIKPLGKITMSIIERKLLWLRRMTNYVATSALDLRSMTNIARTETTDAIFAKSKSLGESCAPIIVTKTAMLEDFYATIVIVASAISLTIQQYCVPLLTT